MRWHKGPARSGRRWDGKLRCHYKIKLYTFTIRYILLKAMVMHSQKSSFLIISLHFTLSQALEVIYICCICLMDIPFSRAFQHLSLPSPPVTWNLPWQECTNTEVGEGYKLGLFVVLLFSSSGVSKPRLWRAREKTSGAFWATQFLTQPFNCAVVQWKQPQKIVNHECYCVLITFYWWK